jgi:two-component system, OmpR family, response regulator
MCILLVEDDQPVREVVVEALADEGFEVCEAETGDQAAGLIEKPPKTFRLLMTDVDLPGKRDGINLARLMQRRHPALPVLYMTGRPEKVGTLGPREALLAKPFTFQDMFRAVRALLADPR